MLYRTLGDLASYNAPTPVLDPKHSAVLVTIKTVGGGSNEIVIK